MRSSIPLSQLVAKFAHKSISGSLDRSVQGVCHDSRAVKPGDLFVCIAGANYDGHQFAGKALEAGAAGVVVNVGGLEAVGESLDVDATVISVKDTRRSLPLIACALQNNPSHRLTVIGVTGTNGKTTTTRMIAAILRAAGKSVGTIGTLGAELDGVPLDSDFTTPEADKLQELLAYMADHNADAVVMEVSSHALAQYRTDGIAFSAGIFTNLTQDHLDFHGSMEAYFEAKLRLFSEYPILYPRPDRKPFVGVINVAGWEGKELVSLSRGDVLTYTPDENYAVLKAGDIKLSATTVRFVAIYDSGTEKAEFNVALPIGGAFQVGNALGAIGCALRLGIKSHIIALGLAEMGQVPGRFESVANPNGDFSVIVDYAHTPDGLENVLTAARKLKPNRLLTVFGCGGDRDTSKRPIMGAIAARLSDVVVVTSDNPRGEDPDSIIGQIVVGMDAAARGNRNSTVRVEPDRRKAIILAVQLAGTGDLVVVAGKGHEDYQIIHGVKHHLDDREEVALALAAGTNASRTIESWEAGRSDVETKEHDMREGQRE